jgi:iron complex transport system permease protein
MLTRSRYWKIIGIYVFIVVILLPISTLIGSEIINPLSIIKDIMSGSETMHAEIFLRLRIPRVLLAFVAGGILAMTGAVFQAILRNPLATPYTLGTTGGGALGAVIAISVPAFSIKFGPFSSVQVLSLLGSFLALGLIYRMSQRTRGVSLNVMLLAGITIGILCGAMILLVRYMSSPHMLVAMDRWLMGGLDLVGYGQLGSIAWLVIPGAGMMFAQARSLNHLSVVGDLMAGGHGVDVPRVRRYCFFGGAIATAGVVSIAGPISFIGLIVPHIFRLINGSDHRLVLPCSFLSGGVLLVVCDTIARTVISPTEIPVGIITAVIGGPVFIILLLRHNF